MEKIEQTLSKDWKKTIDENGKVMFINNKKNLRYSTDRITFERGIFHDIVRQKYNGFTKAMTILHGKDLTGKVALITGGASGVGLETAKSLAKVGCEIILACKRNGEKVMNAMKEIYEVNKKCRVNFIRLDLEELKSCELFCCVVLSQFKHIDYLILNADPYAIPYSQTKDGYDTIFQVCHLSHFYITLRLFDTIDDKSRIIVLTSESHHSSNLPSENLTKELLNPPRTKYSSIMQYSNVKLCNLLFAYELARRGKAKGITVFAAYPGNYIQSNIQKSWLYKVMFFVLTPFIKTLEEAAATIVYCATADELEDFTGLYFNNCYISHSSKLSKNENLAKELWELSKRFILSYINDLVTSEEYDS